MLPRIRLLPLVIVSAALLFGVKVGNIWLGIETSVGVSVAEAQEAGKKGKEPAADGSLETTTAPAEGAALPADPNVFDPSQYSKSEIDILQQLGERRAELERRGRELDMRENLLAAAEKRVEKKIAELKNIEAAVNALIRRQDDQENKRMASLVRIYEKMKPKDAARILERLDLGILVDVAGRMKEAKMAAILADMDPSQAKKLTMELATRRRLPEMLPTGGTKG